VPIKGFLTVFFGLIAIFAWYYSVRVSSQRKERSPLPAYIFAGIVTLAALILWEQRLPRPLHPCGYSYQPAEHGHSGMTGRGPFTLAGPVAGSLLPG